MPERWFVDANLFLRYLTDDVPEQAQAVEVLLRQAAAGEIILVTSHLVVAELVWTMESFYQLSRQRVQENILALLATPGLEVEDGQLVLQAILWYAQENVDYADAYNAAWAMDHGLTGVSTFDRRHFSRLPGLRLLVPGEDAS